MKFIIGIGNPGKEYEKTRHNVGFRVMDALKNDKLGGVRLVKPQTYVNHTGDEVIKLSRRNTIVPRDLLVVCDDVNLPLGKIRLRAGGSAGGHKGLSSIIGALNTEDFPRLRVGVGGAAPAKPASPAGRDLPAFVLGNFTKAEEKTLSGVLKKTVHICHIWAKEGFKEAMDYLSINQQGASE